MFPWIHEHGNELARRAQLEAMARLSAPAQQRSTHPVAQLLRRLGRHLGFFAALRAAVRSRLGALSVFPGICPRRCGAFVDWAHSAVGRLSRPTRTGRRQLYEGRKLSLTPLACIRWWRVGPLRVAAWATWGRAAKVAQLGLPQAGKERANFPAGGGLGIGWRRGHRRRGHRRRGRAARCGGGAAGGWRLGLRRPVSGPGGPAFGGPWGGSGPRLRDCGGGFRGWICGAREDGGGTAALFTSARRLRTTP